MKRQTKRPLGAPLRRRAEEALAASNTQVEVATAGHVQRLVHELKVHEIELETQNEELRAARLELEDALHRYTELFDFAPIGYVVLAPDGNIRQVNFACARMLGTERSPLIGLPFHHFVAAADRPAFRAFLGRTLTCSETSPSESVEISLLGAGAHDVRLSGVAARDVEPAALISIKDITERKRAELMLRQESRRKDEFLAALSHELRNPLAPIQSSLALLDRVAPGGEPARKALAIIARQVGHLTHIVDDLLDVTRVAQGKVHLQKEPVELGHVVQRALEDHRVGFETHGIVLEGRLGPEPLWVDADATRLLQIIGNLLSNALKFTPRGGRVVVSLRPEGRSAVLSVRDTGVGIAAEMCEHIFEPFFQAPQSLDRSRGGLGLGLPTVKGLVELHGGTVSVASKGVGRGAELTVRLPLIDAPAPKAQPAVKPAPGRRRVLVIDDSVEAADSLCDLLKLENQDVQVAHDGPEGLALARDFKPEIVFCDIGLPGMDGYQVARAMRADEQLRQASLVALSGYAHPEDFRRSAEAGFDHHLAKPAALESLLEILAKPSPPLAQEPLSHLNSVPSKKEVDG